MEKLKIREAIIVEGRYDKAAVSRVADTVILETAGFGIFSDREKLALFRRLAQTRGLILLTDSDGGGTLIRSFLKSALDPGQVKHAYIPEIFGKEHRKCHPSRAGTLGVEGMSDSTLRQALLRCGATLEGKKTSGGCVPPLTKADLYAMGLSGGNGSAGRRSRLLRALCLPSRLSSNAMLDLLNILMTRQALADLVETLSDAEAVPSPAGNMPN